MNKDLYSHLPIGSRVKDAKGRILTLVEKKETGWLFFRAITDGSGEPFAYRLDGQPDCDPHAAPLAQILSPTFADLREGSLFVTKNGSLCELTDKTYGQCCVWFGGHGKPTFRGDRAKDEADGANFYMSARGTFGPKSEMDYLRPANDEEAARVDERRRELQQKANPSAPPPPPFSSLKEGSLFVTKNGSICELTDKASAECCVWFGGHGKPTFRGDRAKGETADANFYMTARGTFGPKSEMDYLRPANEKETARVDERRRELEGTPAETPRQDTKALTLVCYKSDGVSPDKLFAATSFSPPPLCLSPLRPDRILLRLSLNIWLPKDEHTNECLTPAIAEVLREKRGPFGVVFAQNGDPLPPPSWSLAPEGSKFPSLVFEQACTIDTNKKNEFGLTITDPFLAALRALHAAFPSVKFEYELALYQPRS